MGRAGEGSITLKEHEENMAECRRQMRVAMKDAIIGAIEDLHAGNHEVQVMMRWSREFYDEIMATPNERPIT